MNQGFIGVAIVQELFGASTEAVNQQNPINNVTMASNSLGR